MEQFGLDRNCWHISCNDMFYQRNVLKISSVIEVSLVGILEQKRLMYMGRSLV